MAAAYRVDAGRWTTGETDLACHWWAAYLDIRSHGKGDDFNAIGVRLEPLTGRVIYSAVTLGAGAETDDDIRAGVTVGRRTDGK